jgi:chemotaxis protein CheZ
MTSGSAAPKDKAYNRKEVVNIIQSVLSGLGKDTDAAKKLHDELTTLAHYIENTRAELAQMRGIEISHNHIPSATDELDAVVGETAKATGAIMDACDKISEIGSALEGAKADELTQAVTSIYEACSFQDITGQRITKVVKALKNIESKVDDIITSLDHTRSKTAPPKEEKKSEGLLNGPQIGGPAVSQEDIDKLLASFDN